MPDCNEAKMWINLAKRDESIASHLKDTFVPLPVETICFHCQQAVEKALKAVLALYEDDIPKTHNIRALTELCKSHIKDTLIDDKVVDTITAFAVITRYIEDRRDFTSDTANFALKYAAQTLKNVMQALGLSDTGLEEAP